MDVSSLQGGHLVFKTWNHFLINDKKLWMDILRQTEPYFEFLSLLSDEDFSDKPKKHNCFGLSPDRIEHTNYLSRLSLVSCMQLSGSLQEAIIHLLL